MNLNRLSYFVALAECKNITHTAAKLYIAQPNLSKQISLFEEEVGVKLFERSRSGVELTPAGELVYDKLKHIPALIETTFERARTQADAHTQMRIGVLEGFDFIRQRYTTLQSLYPDYRFVFERRSYETLNARLAEGKYDAIITMGWEGNTTLSPNVTCANIKPLDVGALICTGHPLANAASLKELENVPFVALDPQISPASYQLVRNVCRIYNIAPRNFYFVENFEDLLLNVETNLTVGVLGCNNGIRAKSEIRTIPIDDQGMYQEVVCWERANRNPLVQDLIRISRELAEKERAARPDH